MHRHLLWLLLSAYVVAGLAPDLGLAIRGVGLGSVEAFGTSTQVSLPLLLLGFLLFNAGLGVRADRLRGLVRDPRLLLLGLGANVLVPIAFLHGIAPALGLWHDSSEVQSILIGIALVAAMPIAGSSTSWSQHGEGDLALSLGLVLFSTVLSPWTTPLVLKAVTPLLAPEYADAVRAFGGESTGLLLGLFVMLPALLGVAVGSACGKDGFSPIRSWLKLLNSIVLLVLVYANASAALPESMANPDVDFLLLALAVVASLCVIAFATGRLLGKLTSAEKSQETALMFGLGMNNNGTGLVIASVVLAAHPRVMLPILIYNLVQHLVAGTVTWLRRPPSAHFAHS